MTLEPFHTPASLPSLSLGNLEVRLARNEADIRAAQRLRYQVFYEERGAHITPEIRALGYDQDDFDDFCDHLLVIDRTLKPGQEVVGTYRLLRRSIADKKGGFYTASEFDITPFLKFKGEILELGRSCVKLAYRTRPTMQLLWRGIAAYATLYGVDLMFGCASFPGTDVKPLEKALSYLHHYHLAPPNLRSKALPNKKASFTFDAKKYTPEELQKEFSLLPSLIKGYIRGGAFIGEGAVLDRDFNTIDVCVVVRMDRLTGRYNKRFMKNTPSKSTSQESIS